jgi:hypothetical protein
MKCPHCLVEFHAEWENNHIAKDKIDDWYAFYQLCPNKRCGNLIFYMIQGTLILNASYHGQRPQGIENANSVFV